MIYDKRFIRLRAELKNTNPNDLFLDSLRKCFGGDIAETYSGIEDTDIEYTNLQEFEFDDFSIIIENGAFFVQFEDPDEGLVMQALVDEGETEPKFPYLFEVGGEEKIIAEEDYLRIKNFVEKEN